MLLTHISCSWIHDVPLEEKPPLALVLAAEWIDTIYHQVRSPLTQRRTL